MQITKFIRKLILLLLILGISHNISGLTQVVSADSLLMKANKFKYTNQDSLKYYIKKASLVARQNNDVYNEIEAKFLLIDTYIRYGDYATALSLCDSLDNIQIQNNNCDLNAKINIKKGIALGSAGLNSQALELYLKSLNAENCVLSISTRNDLYYYISTTYYSMNNINECKNYLKLGIELSIKNNLDKDLISSYLLYASTFNQLDSVRYYVNKSTLILNKYPGYVYEKVAVLGKKASVCDYAGNLRESKSLYKEVIRISELHGFNNRLSILCNNYSYLFMDEKKYDSAKYYIDKALSISRYLKSVELKATVFDTYSDYYKGIDNYEKALECLDSSVYYRNEYRENQQIQRSQVLTATLKTEQKEKEILQKEKQISSMWLLILGVISVMIVFMFLFIFFRQKARLQKAKLETIEMDNKLEVADALLKGQDSERKRLAMDLHDELGARMSALRFMIDGSFGSHTKYKDVVSSIEVIHQNIRELSHRMLPSQLEKSGLVVSLNSLIASINNTGDFAVEFNTNLKKRLSDKLEINIYHIIFELINNAIKHSKGNHVFVQLMLHDDVLQLSVEDNGGDADISQEGDSMGLVNVKTRIEYLGGKLIEDFGKSLTLFMIEIPLTNKKQII